MAGVAGALAIGGTRNSASITRMRAIAARRRVSATWTIAGVLILTILGACEPANEAQAWCDTNLVRVVAAGQDQGSAFDFEGRRSPVSWSEYAASSEVERFIIRSEATNGAATYDSACKAAYEHR